MSLLDGRFIEVSAEDILAMQSASPQAKLMFMNELLRQVLAIQEQLELESLGQNAPPPPPPPVPPHGGTTELPVRSPGPHRMVPQRVAPENDVDVGDDPRGTRFREREEERRAATRARSKTAGDFKEGGQKIPHRESVPTGQKVKVAGQLAQVEAIPGDAKVARLRYAQKTDQVAIKGGLTGDIHQWNVQRGDEICAAPEIRSKIVGKKGQPEPSRFGSAKRNFLITG